MLNSKKSNHIYDYAIIGSGLSGLAIATAVSRFTSNVVLIESADTFGGINRSIQSPLGPVNNGLRFIPDTELAHKSISFLEMLMMTSLRPEVTEIPAMTFESGQLKPFVGFGNESPAFYDEITYFANSRSIKTLLEPHEWTQILFNNFSGDFLPKSYVTKFHQTDGKVTHLTINGQKSLHAMNFIYCGPVKSLKTLLPEGALNTRAMGKLSKNQYWTAVGVDFLHSVKVSDISNIHVLNGTTSDDIGPCVGRFHSAEQVNDTLKQYSQWLTFLDDEEAEDSELIGAALKKVKRQIKRAYPNAFDTIEFERIVVSPSFSGNGDLKLNSNQTIPGLENLWIGSSQMHAQRNLLGGLLQAEFIASALGCHPTQAQELDGMSNEASDLESSEAPLEL
jgi:hypothetical protein